MGRVAKFLMIAAALVVLAAAAVLGLAHRSIRAIEPELPGIDAIATPVSGEREGPIRLWAINTASQAMPRAAVLDAARDPYPALPYVMSFPAFALEWANGRIFLIDLGMQRQDALAFGRPNQWLAGAEPIEAHRDVAAALGADRARVSGVGFTHLHSDHTGGAVALCRDAMRPIHVFYTPLQAIESNYTTRFGRGPIERAGCLEPRLLSLGPLHPVPGFPGLSVFATGGHTPGSQVFVAHLGGEERGRSLVFAGDLVNHWDGIRHNVPKPGWYSLWIVPEHTRRLDRLRRYLAELSERPGVTVLVSHDRGHLEAEGIPFAR